MTRQEPVIGTESETCRTLTERVLISWGALERIAAGPREPTLGLEPASPVETESVPTENSEAAPKDDAAPADGQGAPAEPAPILVPVPHEPQPLILTDAEKNAIIERLAPQIESSVRQGLHDALELAVSNAVTRMKSDVQRSLSQQVLQAVDEKLRELDLSDLVRR